MKPSRTIHAPAPSPVERSTPSRREFLKAVCRGAAGLAVGAAASGCIVMPAFFETLNTSLKDKLQSALVSGGYRPLSNLSAPELGGHIDFIAKNSNLLGPMEQLDANSLSREWSSLSDFIKPCFPLNCSSTKSQLRENVKLLINTESGSGSGTLVTSEGHILTATHVLDAVGTSPFSKVTSAPGLDVAIAKINVEDQSSYPRALARLSYTKPCSSANVIIYGYPANTGGDSFEEVKGTVALHDSAFGVILLLPLAQALAGSDLGDFKFYEERGADLHGTSGGPVALEDGRIVGVISKGAMKGEKDAVTGKEWGTNISMAMDTGCIREAVIRYMDEHLVGPIRELVIRINSRLG